MAIISKFKSLFKKGSISVIIIHYVKIFLYLMLKKKYPYKWKEITDDNIEINNDKKKIIYVCDGFKNHGGITDRFKGLITTYSEAKRLNIPFYIYWNSPFELSNFLIPNTSNDWRINKNRIHFNYCFSFPFILDISPMHYKNLIKKYLFRYVLKDKRDILVYSNLMHEKKNRAILFNELFRPSEHLQKAIDKHLRNIAGKYYSITFRFGNYFGDFKDNVSFPHSENDKEILLKKNIIELTKVIQSIPKEYKILITSDSLYFLQKTKKIDKRIYIIEQELMHIDFYDNKKASKNTWLKTFLDFYLLMNAEKLIQFKTDEMYNSSFPRFAAEICKKPYYLHEF